MPILAWQEEPKAEDASMRDEETVRELLANGVRISRVAELLGDRVSEKRLNQLAREVVVTQTDSAAGDLGPALLQRSKSAAQDSNFMDKTIESLGSEAPEDLLDPLFSTLMRDPVVISSGYVLDRSSVLDAQGRLKFRSCPFTRADLNPLVYPLVEKKSKLVEFKTARLEAMTSMAGTLIKDKPVSAENYSRFDQVVDLAERFLDELGEETYLQQSRNLANLRLEASQLPGRNATPAELAKIYIRISRTLSTTADDDADFRQKVMAMQGNSRQALVEGELERALSWWDACKAVCDAAKLDLKLASLRLEIAKKRDEDLTQARRNVFLEIRGDPEAVRQFLGEEGIDMDVVRDRRPIFLYRNRIDDRTMSDAWQSAVASAPLEGTVGQVMVAVKTFRDQNWGNAKANIGLALYNAAGDLVTRCNVFGTYRTDACTSGVVRVFRGDEDIVAKATANFTYRLEYTVGGGGGHTILVDGLACLICPLIPSGGSRTDTVRMADPEGDEGSYTGPVDETGKAHGNGELFYDDGEVFVGEFSNGNLVEGVLYSATSPKDTMRSGEWIMRVDRSVVSKFPLPFQVDLSTADDGDHDDYEDEDEDDEDEDDDDDPEDFDAGDVNEGLESAEEDNEGLESDEEDDEEDFRGRLAGGRSAG